MRLVSDEHEFDAGVREWELQDNKTYVRNSHYDEGRQSRGKESLKHPVPSILRRELWLHLIQVAVRSSRCINVDGSLGCHVVHLQACSSYDVCFFVCLTKPAV